MDIVACGKDGLINMIEVGGREVQESAIVGTPEASEEIEKLQAWQRGLSVKSGKEAGGFTSGHSRNTQGVIRRKDNTKIEGVCLRTSR